MPTMKTTTPKTTALKKAAVLIIPLTLLIPLAAQETHTAALAHLILHHGAQIADLRLKHITLHVHTHGKGAKDRQRIQNASQAHAQATAALDLPSDTPLPLIDLHAARARIEALEWVASASLRRILPDTLEVHLHQQQPSALWQRNGHLFLVNRQAQAFLHLGAVPPPHRENPNPMQAFEHLPRLTGSGALEQGIALLETLDAHPFLRDKLHTATRVGERRWDLQLAGNMQVRLPQEGLHSALERLQHLHQRYDIFNRHIRGIDLRLADRIAFRLGAGAALPKASAAASMAQTQKHSATHDNPPHGDG